MRDLLKTLDRRTEEFGRAPLFELMRDASIEPRQRLSFVPALAHFVMTFADLYGLVFREEPPRDKYQEIVNAHTHEDGGHWKWFLADLEKLGHDPRIAFSDALRFVWSDATVSTRLLSYHMCHLGLGADSLGKLVLVLCIEATGRVSLRHSAQIGREISAITGKSLVYFGAHHFDTESDHTLEQDDIRRMIGDISLEPERSRELSGLIDKSFTLFTAFADELLAFAKSGQRVGPA
jgi:hypothetical protein